MMYGTPVTCHVYDSSSNSKASIESLVNKASTTILLADSFYINKVHAEGPASEAHIRCSR